MKSLKIETNFILAFVITSIMVYIGALIFTMLGLYIAFVPEFEYSSKQYLHFSLIANIPITLVVSFIVCSIEYIHKLVKRHNQLVDYLRTTGLDKGKLLKAVSKTVKTTMEEEKAKID